MPDQAAYGRAPESSVSALPINNLTRLDNQSPSSFDTTTAQPTLGATTQPEQNPSVSYLPVCTHLLLRIPFLIQNSLVF